MKNNTELETEIRLLRLALTEIKDHSGCVAVARRIAKLALDEVA